MWIILGLMAGGVLLGFLLSDIKNINLSTQKITSIVIYFLLFFMGLGVGVNKDIMSHLKDYGYHAIVIALFSITGSIFLSKIVENYFYRAESNKNVGNNKKEEIQ